MPIIKIPSSNIYSTAEKSLIADNTITGAQINSWKFSSQNADASNVLNLSFYKQGSLGAYDFTFVGNQSSINEYIFSTPTVYETNNMKSTGTIKLKMKDFSIVKTSANSDGGLLITSHKLKSTKRWAVYNTSTGQLAPTEEIISTYQPQITSIVDKTVTLVYSLSVYYKIGNLQFYLLSDTISLFGEYFEKEEETLSLGTGGASNTFTLPSNELENINNKYLNSSYSNLKLSTVISKYSSGKEVIILRCSLAKYYDTNNNLVICPDNSTYPAVFENYDVVQPYVFTTKGEIPLRTNIDGTPKIFEVIGVDFIYGGVFWQELTLQEYVE